MSDKKIQEVLKEWEKLDDERGYITLLLFMAIIDKDFCKTIIEATDKICKELKEENNENTR